MWDTRSFCWMSIYTPETAVSLSTSTSLVHKDIWDSLSKPQQHATDVLTKQNADNSELFVLPGLFCSIPRCNINFPIKTYMIYIIIRFQRMKCDYFLFLSAAELL